MSQKAWKQSLWSFGVWSVIFTAAKLILALHAGQGLDSWIWTVPGTLCGIAAGALAGGLIYDWFSGGTPGEGESGE